MSDKDDIARYCGFRTYAELRSISQPLPMEPGDTIQSYVARRPDGGWFVWEDKPPSPEMPYNGKFANFT